MSSYSERRKNDALAVGPNEPDAATSWTLKDAVSFVYFARSMRFYLPDGQWEQLREIVRSYRESYGSEPQSWPLDVQRSFAAECEENFYYWI